MSFDSSCGFLFYHLHYYGGCQYVKGTKQILIAVCVVEFTGLHSNFLVCKLQFYTVKCKVFGHKCVYSFYVFFTKLFWQQQLPNFFCKNYRIFFFFFTVYKITLFCFKLRPQPKCFQAYLQESFAIFRHSPVLLFLPKAIKNCFQF